MPAEASRPRATVRTSGSLVSAIGDADEDDGRHDQPPRHAHAGLVGNRQLAREQPGDAAAVSFHEAVDEPCHHEGGHEQEHAANEVGRGGAGGNWEHGRAQGDGVVVTAGEGSVGDEPAGSVAPAPCDRSWRTS